MFKVLQNIIIATSLLVSCGVQAIQQEVPKNAESTSQRNEKNITFIKGFCASQGVKINDLELCSELLRDYSSGGARIGYDVLADTTSLRLGYGYGLTPFAHEKMLSQKQREFVLAHECGHRLNGHHEKRIAYVASNPMLAASAFGVNRFVGRTKVVAGVAALSTSVCHALLFPQWVKQCEFQADLASKDPETLKAGIELFKRWEQADKQPTRTFSPIKYIQKYLTTVHPPYSERIERLEDRIKEIE